MPTLLARLAAGVSLATAIVFLSVAITAAAAAECSFPSERKQCWSPDKRFVVQWVMSEAARDRQMLWRDTHTGRHGLLRTFKRSAATLWSPTGNHLAVTDAAGSDNSHALLWDRLDGQPRSFEDDLRRYVPAHDQIWRNHHQYFDVVRWVSARQVLVRAWGYGDPKEAFLDRVYVWDIQGAIRRVQRPARSRIDERTSDRYFKEDHLTGADYVHLSADGTYTITGREHMGIWVHESGRWEKDGLVLTFNPKKAGRALYRGREGSYKGHTFLTFDTDDAPSIVIPEHEVRQRIDANPKTLPEYVFFEIDRKTYQQETSATYPFRTLRGGR